jgi:hypothetical protein
MDAFGRGRVDVEKRPRARAQLGVLEPAKSGADAKKKNTR